MHFFAVPELVRAETRALNSKSAHHSSLRYYWAESTTLMIFPVMRIIQSSQHSDLL